MKKIYNMPIIKKVYLDPKQAVLQVCKASGAVWMSMFSMCVFEGTMYAQSMCSAGFKGATVASVSLTVETYTPGS
ncbi:MAG: hypothetical protein PHQ52_04135 [Candidatus Omnitrophica bacterium]|nr:hypothetical protein [Candidatus Omnitrophota bacterium]